MPLSVVKAHANMKKNIIVSTSSPASVTTTCRCPSSVAGAGRLYSALQPSDNCLKSPGNQTKCPCSPPNNFYTTSHISSCNINSKISFSTTSRSLSLSPFHFLHISHLELHQLQEILSRSLSPFHFLHISSCINSKNSHLFSLSGSPSVSSTQYFLATYITSEAKSLLAFILFKGLKWGQVIFIDKMYMGSTLTR